MIKRIFKYIKGTINLGICYKAAWKTGELEAYSDADYASDTTTRKSISGIVLKYSGGAIVWASRRQKTVYRFQLPKLSTLLPVKQQKILYGQHDYSIKFHL